MKKLLLVTLLSAVAFALAAVEYSMVFTSNKKSAIYQCGEEMVFTAQLLIDGKPATDSVVKFDLYHNGKKIKSGKQAVSAEPLKISTKLDKPGWAHIYCTYSDKK